MKAKRRKRARVNPSSSVNGHEPDTCTLLALPVEVFHQVMDMLGPDGLLKLLQTSKTMAQEVMKHSPRIRLKLQLRQNINLAAVRKLLQLAPPACLKLMLDGTRSGGSTGDWEQLNPIFSMVKEALPSHNRMQTNLQQYPCVQEVHIQGFILPDLVPPGLAAACPNMHTLHIQGCGLKDFMAEPGLPQHNSTSNRHNSRESSASASSSRAACLDVCPAKGLCTLMISSLYAPSLQSPMSVRLRLTRSMHPVACYADRLQRSVPSVSSLTLHERYLTLHGRYNMDESHIQILGPQLMELHMPDLPSSSDLHAAVRHAQLQQLQKLVLPKVEVCTAADMQLLLSFPRLTHMEFCTVHFTEDFSHHKCSWQYLRLHLRSVALGQCVDALARLPLHSLTQPLALGCTHPLQSPLQLPLEITAELQRLAQQLMKFRVRVLSDAVSWQGEPGFVVPGAQLAPALLLIGPSMGPHPHVALNQMTVDQQMLEAVAMVYGSHLTELVLKFCAVEGDMQPAWHAALSGLQGLRSVTFIWANPEDRAGLVKAVQDLAAAMAQQPAGRCMDVATWGTRYKSSGELVEDVLDGVQQELQGVQVTARQQAGLNRTHHRGTVVCEIKTKHKPIEQPPVC